MTKWFDILNSQCLRHKLKIQFRHYHYKITHLEIQSLQQESWVHGNTCTVQLSLSQLEAGKKMHFHLIMESSMTQHRTVNFFERRIFSRHLLCSKFYSNLREYFLVIQDSWVMNIEWLKGKARQPQTKEVAL